MIRENWRVAVLLLLLLVSGAFLFVPGVGLGTAAAGPTNLQYGLELSGGTRIRAPLVGMTAEGADLGDMNPAAVREAIANEIQGVDSSEVAVIRLQSTTGSSTAIEVRANVSREAFASALDEAGITYDEIRDGLTAPTRSEAVTTIRDKIDESGLAGGTVQQVTTSTGNHFIVVEVPNRNRSQVRRLVARQGVVRMVAHFPTGNGTYRNETVLTGEQIAQVGTLQEPNSQIPSPHVPVTLTDQGARSFAEDMRQYGFTGPGVSACRFRTSPDDAGYCLYTVLDGEVVYAASMSPGLAQDIRSGDFVNQQSFVITATNRSEARALQINLRAGALPAPLDLDEGTSYYLAPSLASNFKLYSLITGLIAVLAVAFVVFLRYNDPVVAAPMVVTALSEIVILLGFAAGVGLALDLSHIAGFIAVIGTGVDDLIIIADEVMAEGSVSSGRVFQNRFRKAFWVIGAAAVTTIIAMSPLAILSLGDLRGFAIVTILGVLVGVLVTRPAYGDILRSFLTDT